MGFYHFLILLKLKSFFSLYVHMTMLWFLSFSAALKKGGKKRKDSTKGSRLGFIESEKLRNRSVVLSLLHIIVRNLSIIQ